MNRQLFLALLTAQQEHNMLQLDVTATYQAWQKAQNEAQEALLRLAKLRQQAAPYLKAGEIISIWVDGTEFAISPVSHPAEIEIRVVKQID
ncbi:MAG: hypothetical protein ACK5BG_12720 [Pseudanabaena sp.]|jgi:hypothetical protein